MNKKELIDIVAEKTAVSKKDIADVVNATLDTITDALRHGDSVKFVGFGTFETRHRSARKGKNPQTGEIVDIPPTTIASFKAGQGLKDAVK